MPVANFSYYTEYMRLGSVRDLDGNTPVLKDPTLGGPNPVYWVFTDISEGKWKNMTIWTTGRYGKEYPKTFGHYHGTPDLETYQVISGKGIFVLQKKFMENGVWIPEKVSNVVLVEGNPGEEVTITPEWGHSWSNIGESPLVTFDDWSAGHSPTDYAMVEKLQGLAYYLVDDNGKPKAVANPKYIDPPEPMWMSAKEFKNLKLKS